MHRLLIVALPLRVEKPHYTQRPLGCKDAIFPWQHPRNLLKGMLIQHLGLNQQAARCSQFLSLLHPL
uniref:Putative leucine-rich repeat receptor-like protein kinase At5g49770 n=1 Tax=Rhizophora mucronata TaxID=61149 RepID=A0A2P2LPS9_RHIMU